MKPYMVMSYDGDSFLHSLQIGQPEINATGSFPPNVLEDMFFQLASGILLSIVFFKMVAF